VKNKALETNSWALVDRLLATEPFEAGNRLTIHETWDNSIVDHRQVLHERSRLNHQ
jgi:hypothetical protein